MSLSPLSLSHSHTLSMNTNAVSGPTSHPPIFFAGMGGRGETEQFQLSILPHEVGSAWLAATPMPFFLPAEQYWWYCALPLQQCLTCVSGVWFLTRVERKKDVCACCFFSFSITPSFFFVIWMGSLFWEERKKKAEGSRGRGTTGNSQSPLPHTDWRQRRPLEYLLLSFVFCSFFSSSRCWEVLCLSICSLSRSSVFLSISPFTWSTISSVYERDKEGERGRGTEKKRTGIFFLAPFILFFFPLLPFIHSFLLSSPFVSLPAFLSLCSPRSLLPQPPPFFLLPPTPPLQSLSTRNFGYFLTPPVLFLKIFYFFALNSSSRVILIGLLVFSIYAFFTFVPFSYFPPFSFFLPPSYASFLADS